MTLKFYFLELTPFFCVNVIIGVIKEYLATLYNSNLKAVIDYSQTHSLVEFGIMNKLQPITASEVTLNDHGDLWRPTVPSIVYPPQL